jgi:ribonuclease III
MPDSPAKLETRLGYRFNDVSLLERALTHSSSTSKGETPESERTAHNETLEFLGDSVLGLAVVERLLQRNPDMDEGGLTMMKHQLVSDRHLAEIATDIGLGEHIILSKGEEGSGGRFKQALLAGAFEAVVGAVFLDGGYTSARNLVWAAFGDRIDSATPKKESDHKTMLQEHFHALKKPAPSYSVISSEGPSHDMTFHVEVRWEGGSAKASGRSKKQAEMTAAGKALAKLGLMPESE